MRTHYTTLCLLLALSAITGSSYAAEQGVLRFINTDDSQLTIDEGRYRPSPAMRINNLGSGLNTLSDAVIGQPVRFTLNPNGQISELWLYPLRADERQRMGIQLGENQQ